MQDDAPWLPPGQIATRKFPVVGERDPAPPGLSARDWRLAITGRVRTGFVLDYGSLLARPQREVACDLHCVTGWSRHAVTFAGVALRDLLVEAGLEADARFVRFEAYSARGHDTSLPLDVALADTWIVHSADGAPLTPAHGHPVRSLTPSKYLYKSVKWLRRIEVLADDRLGYWERDHGYHNDADPWREARFVSGSLKPDDVRRLREAGDLDRYRGRTILGCDLRGWNPADRDLRRVELKNCDLRGARLAGADMRQANFTHSNLRGADLAGADLREADLEGADLSGADLSGAHLEGALLGATRFFEDAEDGSVTAALVTGMTWSEDSGVLEGQEAFLRASDAARPRPASGA